MTDSPVRHSAGAGYASAGDDDNLVPPDLPSEAGVSLNQGSTNFAFAWVIAPPPSMTDPPARWRVSLDAETGNPGQGPSAVQMYLAQYPSLRDWQDVPRDDPFVSVSGIDGRGTYVVETDAAVDMSGYAVLWVELSLSQSEYIDTIVHAVEWESVVPASVPQGGRLVTARPPDDHVVVVKDGHVVTARLDEGSVRLVTQGPQGPPGEPGLPGTIPSDLVVNSVSTTRVDLTPDEGGEPVGSLVPDDDEGVRLVSDGNVVLQGSRSVAFHDFVITDDDPPTKGYRYRTSGGALDVDFAGADLYLSGFETPDYGGTQHMYLRLESGVPLAHATGRWEFSDTPWGSPILSVDPAEGSVTTTWLVVQDGNYGTIDLGNPEFVNGRIELNPDTGLTLGSSNGMTLRCGEANGIAVEGRFFLAGDPVAPLEAATKQYVDAMAPLVLGPTDPVPPGTPAGKIIARTVWDGTSEVPVTRTGEADVVGPAAP